MPEGTESEGGQPNSGPAEVSIPSLQAHQQQPEAHQASSDSNIEDQLPITIPSEESAPVSSSSIAAANNDANADSDSCGSSLSGATFNFTNCIVGAGAIGLGGAFADSGGLISVVTIIFFAILTKLSLDLVVSMSVENSQPSSSNSTNNSNNTSPATTRSASYEELGFLAYGQIGRMAVLLSKFLYSFGCMVAYIIVVKDNFTPALQHFIYADGHHHDNAWFNQFLSKDGAEDTITWLLGSFVILPLCLLRDMTPLSSLGAVSIASMCAIVFIVIHIYITEPNVRQEGGSVYENWFEIRPGYVESWGTFVFTFVSQHTVNLAFESLKPEIRTIDTWEKVSSFSILVATSISLTVGVVVYMTFWDSTQSDLFNMYPPMRVVDIAKMLLCVTMLLTFPLPFFSCRELIIVSIIQPLTVMGNNNIQVENEAGGDLVEPLLVESNRADNNQSGTEPPSGDDEQDNEDSTSVIFEDPAERSCCRMLFSFLKGTTEDFSIMIPGEEKQLSLPLHLALSITFWGLSTYLAIVSPNLGDILDLVGAASGTSMAFILPGLLSFKLQGYTRLALFILVVGGPVGIIGTICSLKKLVIDIL